MKEETWTCTYVLQDGTKYTATITAPAMVIDDMRYFRLDGVAKTWKKVA